MIGKVMLPKFVADKLQKLQANEGFVIMHEILLDNEIAEWTEGENNLIRLASAIEYGYEVYRTTEEKTREELIEMVYNLQREIDELERNEALIAKYSHDVTKELKELKENNLDDESPKPKKKTIKIDPIRRRVRW